MPIGICKQNNSQNDPRTLFCISIIDQGLVFSLFLSSLGVQPTLSVIGLLGQTVTVQAAFIHLVHLDRIYIPSNRSRAGPLFSLNVSITFTDQSTFDFASFT